MFSFTTHRNHKCLIAIVAITLLLASCSATYNQRMQRYEDQLYNGQYEKAFNELDDIKLLKKDRNRFLYLAEKGRTANLLGWYDTSNVFLNQADYFLEDHFKTAGDVAKSNLINPMMETYLGEDFERFLVHFYKAINYLQLGDNENALVEARRISNENNRLSDTKNGKVNKYSSDAFSLMLQGIIFEKGGQLNDAFVSYRNAANLFLEKDNKELYGVAMPAQLQQDVLRTATQLGFASDVSFYEQVFGTTYQPAATNGELVLFWESGKAPVKGETNPAFQLLGNNDNYYFVNTGNRQRYDLDATAYNACYTSINNTPAILSSLFNITLPIYNTTRSTYTDATAFLNGNTYSFEKGLDVNVLANATLQERQGKEIMKALTRQVVKRITEKSAGAIAKSIAMPDESKKKESEKTAEEKKKEQKDKDKAEAIGAGVQLLTALFNTATEKADTRNWQSLPAFIHYVRIPLQNGANEITLQFEGNGRQQSQQLSVQSSGGLQVRQLTLLH